MSIRASCGHILAEEEGPDGMGWSLATRSYSSEGLPAVSHGSYCAECRTKALAEPDYVLADDAAETSWLHSEGANAPAEPQRDGPGVPASFGVWSVWNGDPREDDDEVEAQPMGTYRGYVDTIALAIAWSDRDVAYFRREADDAPAEDLQAAEDDSELPECVGLNVIQGEALLSDGIAAIEPFFVGRPVFVKYSGWGNCVALFPATGDAGAQYIRQQAKLRAVLSKLTADDVAILRTHGLETTPNDHYSPSVPLLLKGSNSG